MATFQVGDGASIQMWSDRRAGTIIEVSGRRVVWQEDIATRTDSNGLSEIQTYSYERNPNGSTRQFTFRKNGRYVTAGDSMRGGAFLVEGRHEYRDPSF